MRILLIVAILQAVFLCGCASTDIQHSNMPSSSAKVQDFSSAQGNINPYLQNSGAFSSLAQPGIGGLRYPSLHTDVAIGDVGAADAGSGGANVRGAGSKGDGTAISSITRTLPTPEGIFACDREIKYEPLPEYYVATYLHYDDATHAWSEKAWPTNMKDLRELLPNLASDVTVNNGDDEANLGGFFGKTWHHRYVTIDFMKSRIEPIKDANGTVLFFARVGAGMRIKIDVHTKDSSLNTGVLLNVLMSVKSGSTYGTISAHLIGMTSDDLNAAAPFTNDISDASIQRIIEGLGSVRAKFNDSTTHYEPQILAQLVCPPPPSNFKK